jgi:hypothetical protein
MKSFLIAGLSAVALSIFTAPVVLGNEVSVVKENQASSIIEVTPNNLVSHGYQGYFSDQGIPSNLAFINAVKSGKVDATKLVESAIALGRLSSETLNNQAYLSAVNSLLQDFNND